MASVTQREKRRERRRSERLENGLGFRALDLRGAKTLDAEARTVEASIATETPVREYDYDRWEFVPRVLLMSGVDLPRSGQIPLLDTHDRYSTAGQIGSVRNLKVVGNELRGELHFSSTAEDQWTKVREGHLTDISAGFQVLQQTYIPAKTSQVIGGREFKGPLNVATKWRPAEGSLCPIGADQQAKLRGFELDNPPNEEQEDFRMDPALKAKLVTRGMPADLSDDDAQQWLNVNLDKVGRAAPEPEKPTPPQIDVGKLVKDALAEERAAQDAWRKNIAQRAELIDSSPEFVAQAVESCRGLADDAVHGKLVELKGKREAQIPAGFGVRITGTGRDEFLRDAKTAIVNRSLQHMGLSEKVQKEVHPEAEHGKDWKRWQHRSMLDIARACLAMDGVPQKEIDYLSNQEIARMAMGFGNTIVGRASPAYHNTASFSLLTENAMNKSMMAGYMEYQPTWRNIARVGAPLSDFKPKRVYNTGALPNLSIWLDNKEMDQASFDDRRESYAVQAYGQSVTYSWQLVVNDDLDALSTTPRKQGIAAGRTINSYVWAIVTSNPTMSDGVALFATATGNRKKDNYITGAATPTVATLGSMRKLLRLMTGENTREGNAGPDILGLTPRFLAVPAALETTVDQLLRSASDPASSNAGVINPFEGMRYFVEPLLDAASTTAWYMFADPSIAPVIEIGFMQGFESPVMNRVEDPKTWSIDYQVAQVFGGTAIDHRGAVSHKGAS